MFKAFLLDQDDTITRRGFVEVYVKAFYAALNDALNASGRTAEIMPYEDYRDLHQNTRLQGGCLYTLLGERYDVTRDSLFVGFHNHIRTADITNDVESAEQLNLHADRILLFTDSSRAHAEYRRDVIGHTLEINAIDDFDGTNMHHKVSSDMRWETALKRLSEKTGQVLTPQDVLLFDDSANVLRKAKSLGFKTAQCHYGYPQSPDALNPSNEFDYTITHVGTFLKDNAHLIV